MSELNASPELDQVSESVSELLHDLPSYVARGLVYLLLLLAVTAGAYSTIGRVDELVSAPGVVVPEGLVRPLQAGTGGRVTRVAVREGEPVSRHQALIYLETETAGAELERAQREREIRKRQLQDLQAAQADVLQVAEARARLGQAETAVLAAQRAVDASIVTAPMDGQVTRLALRGVGETVQPGQTVAEIAPAGSPLMFEAAVLPSDVGRLRVGQTARVKVHAFPHQEYGVVEGIVVSVSPDTQAQGEASPAYRVVVRPEAAREKQAGKPIELRLGLTATVEVVTERRRIVDLFLNQVRGGH